MQDDVLTTTEAARLLGISVRTAQLLIEGGGMPSWKTPGGHRRVHRADVLALLSEGKAQGRPRSAMVQVVTPERRQALFQAPFEGVGHVLPQFQGSVLSAAMALGGRMPAVVVVDVEAWKEEGLRLLQGLAADSRFKNVELVALLPKGRAQARSLPARASEATLETLADVLRRLTTSDSAASNAIAAPAGDFPVGANEARRLLAVQKSGLVDTPAEPAFDRVTWLASNDLKSPVALMTILTPERQWFKSRQGLEMPDTPRGWAFCNHTVLQKDVFEVRDLAKHASFSTNPAVAGAPHFRFYAGAPVHDPDGYALGSICVIDYRPRQLDKNQRRTLRELAAIASDGVRLREMGARG